MNQLQEKELMLDSREVAEMVGKAHNKLLRDIRTYIDYLAESNFGQSDFFIKSFYINSQNKEQPCYKITKKGCEFIAHKLTGQKGAEFTATYINKFHEMEDKLKPKSQLDILRGMIDQLEVAQREAREAKQIVQNIKDTIIHTDEDWRNWINDQFGKICREKRDYRDKKKQSYDILENRARCRLSIRLDNLRDRMRDVGATDTAVNKACKLDVIEADPRLKEIYTMIVEKMAIKYSGGGSGETLNRINSQKYPS